MMLLLLIALTNPMPSLTEIRDQFQQRLLTCLYRGSETTGLVLKGGGAMRVLTESARFTKDLDFDHDPRRSLGGLQKSVRAAIERAARGSNLTGVRITEPKQTETVARWKIAGHTVSGEELRLTIEVSRRRQPDIEHVQKLPVQLADRTLPRVYVNVYDEPALVDNKLAALLDEKRTAPRDIYDLDLLLARGNCPSAAALSRLANVRGAVLERITEKLDLMPWELFRDEVLPTLPDEIRANMDEDEYLATKLRLIEALRRCIGES